MARARGFTLVELLVVAVIVAVLLGLVLPALTRSRRAAYHAACLANLRQLGVAHAAYAADHRDYLPPVNQWSRGRWRTTGEEWRDKSEFDVCRGWQETLAVHYLNSQGRFDLPVFQCPFDTAGRALYAGDAGAAQWAEIRRDETRLSYARVRADGLSTDGDYGGVVRELVDDEGRLAAMFWPHRLDDARCVQARDGGAPCLYNCAPGTRMNAASRIMVLVESHDSVNQVQTGGNAQVPAGHWWTFLGPAPAEGALNHPHWSRHNNGRDAVSANALAGDGHAENLPAGALPHARWWLMRRTPGFPPPDGHRTGNPYGFMPEY